ncbi:MAG: hypothetical protein ACRDRD_15575 [Pseudonocardiaceae bacterium]
MKLGATPAGHSRGRVVRTSFAAHATATGYVLPVYAAASRSQRRGSPASVRRLVVTGLPGTGVTATAVDPLTGRAVSVHAVARGLGSTVVSLRVTRYPRLVTISRRGNSGRRGGTTPKPTKATGRPAPTPTPTPAPTPNPASTWVVPFLASGPWRTPVPASAPLDSQSPALVSNLMGQIQNYYGHVALNTSSYSAPIYTVPADQPTVNLAFNNCQSKSSLDPDFAAQLRNVPVPADAMPSIGTDSDMVIWQPSTDTEWEFWKMAKDPGTGVWSTCWGGRLDHVSRNPGIFPSPYGTSASGLPMLGYVIRVSELQAGVINHAISLTLPLPRATAYSWPANRTDGQDTNPTDPAEGERFRLDPSLDLSTLNLSPGALTIARAMQQYGLIVTDTSGAVAVDAEDPRPYETNGAPDPYTSLFPGGQYSWLQGIPWQDLQAMAWDYGKPAS